MNASRAWLKNNQEAAYRFIKSTAEAIALLKQDKKRAFHGMAKWYNITDPKKQEYFYREVLKMPRKPYPSVEGIKRVMEIYDCYEMRKYPPEYFYDESFVRQLDVSGYLDSLYQ